MQVLLQVSRSSPQGVERNLVITSWEWSSEKHYLHDLIASDRRHPTVNAHGPLYGSPEYSTDLMPILDPRTSKVKTFKMPVRDADMPEALGPGHAARIKPLGPSAYWGEDNPSFSKQGSDHPSAKAFPLQQSSRQVAMLDPKTMKYTFIDTCFGTHHPQFGYDADDTLWLSAPARWRAGSTLECSSRPAMPCASPRCCTTGRRCD